MEYAETLVFTEKALDETTIVVDINLKARNNGEGLLVGQYVSLKASLEADIESAFDKSQKNYMNVSKMVGSSQRWQIMIAAVIIAAIIKTTSYVCQSSELTTTVTLTITLIMFFINFFKIK